MRPYNYLPTQPGRGATVVEQGGVSLGVVNLSGIVHLQAASPPLVAVDAALREVAGADHVLVDMHAEMTSEKVALGWYLDGKVTAVVGTHTHVPTADSRVLPGGTAYITDVGMTGARGGVIGMKKEQSIAVMRTHMPMRYEPSDEDPWLNGVLIRRRGTRARSPSSKSCAHCTERRGERESVVGERDERGDADRGSDLRGRAEQPCDRARLVGVLHAAVASPRPRPSRGRTRRGPPRR